MGIEELVAGDAPAPYATARLAVVASTPADTTERVYVTLPHVDASPDHPDGKHLHGPCPWTPRIIDESHYGIPEAGDLALVVYNEEDEPVIANWWPADA